MKLEAIVDAKSVQSREDLAEFLEILAKKVQRGDISIHNSSAADVLDGAAGWVRDFEGYFLNRNEKPPTQPTWGLIAMIFSASLVYE